MKPSGAHHIFQFRGKDEARSADEPTGEWAWCSAAHVVSDHIRCRYGKPGDRLWVRETFIAFGRWETRFSEKKGRDEWHFMDMTLETGQAYRFDGALPNAKRAGAAPAWWRRPSIHMPRAASRITLEVTGVRVERLDQITEDDARAEGAAPAWLDVDGETVNLGQPTYRQGFARLWRDINGDESWDANPWVWVVEFMVCAAIGQTANADESAGSGTRTDIPAVRPSDDTASLGTGNDILHLADDREDRGERA
ncbi:hypothetical protein QCE62_07145 [Caballeronia sp. LZ033]|nr:hypothetical protein [Caballeronia sp. LZ033]